MKGFIATILWFLAWIGAAFFMVTGCTIVKPVITLPSGLKIEGTYKYLWQDKAWCIRLADGTQVDFSNDNKPLSDALAVAGEAVKRIPIAAP